MVILLPKFRNLFWPLVHWEVVVECWKELGRECSLIPICRIWIIFRMCRFFLFFPVSFELSYPLSRSLTALSFRSMRASQTRVHSRSM